MLRKIFSLSVLCLTAAIAAAMEFDLSQRFSESAPGAKYGIATADCTVSLPADAPVSQAQLYLKDRDGFWYQQLADIRLTPGTNRVSFALAPDSALKWETSGHSLVWNRRSLITPQFIRLKIFPCESGAELLSCDFIPMAKPETPPEPSMIRPNTESVPCFGLYEVRFRLPDRYADPFNPDEIAVTAVISSPETNRPPVVIPGFYLQDYYVTTNSYADERTPCGHPEWAIRFSPTVPGNYTCRIIAKDEFGSRSSAPLHFSATPSDGPDFVRVSKRDWRHFETAGKEFHPIGHNIRSPFDTRLDDQFPWVLRHPGGFMTYQRYFSDMAKAGENIAEVWMCQWSLGLEWSTTSPYYHGLGDYNLGNAWELDQVLRMARANGLRVNLVLNNHGRAGLAYDSEWPLSPYNVEQGGFLPADNPMAFFSDSKAIDYQKRICRYIAARWGWDSTVFAWELWSELDLCGFYRMKLRPQYDQTVIEWHRQIGDYLHTVDPNQHLISTHISSDYRAIGPALSSIPQIDHCCVDAYHFSENPLHIVDLVKATASSLARFQKPALITEFGGCSMGAGLSHLKCELHAALWASACSTLGATPFFWWWGLIEEQNLYGEYTAVKEFSDPITYNDPLLKPIELTVSEIPQNPSDDPVHHTSVALANGTNLFAWVYTKDLIDISKGLPVKDTNAHFVWSPVTNGTYRVAFCSTATGKPFKQQDFRTNNGSLSITVPPFKGDIAIKAKPILLAE